MFENTATEQVSTSILAYLNQANMILKEGLNSEASEIEMSTTRPQCSETKQKTIFVCTFCQVFSISSSAIADHIGKEHGQQLTVGTVPENYVSKLQSLKNNNDNKPRKRVGRPKKEAINNPIVTYAKVVEPDPIPGPDGFYHCKKCRRQFSKLRQFSRHVCLEIYSQDEYVDEKEVDCDKTADFKANMTLERGPWTKMKKHKVLNEKKSSSDKSSGNVKVDFQEDISKYVLKWRDDPKYVPLFKNEDEKKAFDNHLKSIDYKCVDRLIDRIKSKSTCWINSSVTPATLYSCTVCKKEFNALSNARSHCLIHTDIKPFTCTKCSFQTNIKGALYTHMRTHTGNLFCCSHCSFQSNKRSHLLDHEQTHSTVRQGCKLCKNTYASLRSLKLHVRTHHKNANGKRYIKLLSSRNLRKDKAKCRICDKSFTSDSKLEAHEQIEHAVIPTSEPLESQIMIETLIVDTTENTSEKSLLNSSEISLLSSSEISLLNSSEISLLNSSEISLLNSSEISLLNSSKKSLLNSSEISLENSFEKSLQNSPEKTLGSADVLVNSPEAVNFTNLQNIPSLFDCSVRIEPLDYQTISYHQYNIECNICDQKFPSYSLLNNHRLLDHSIAMASEHDDNQIKAKAAENPFEDLNFADPQVLSSLLECSVRIEPLNEQLVEFMLNNLLQEKSNQSVELFDNVFQQPSPTNLLISNDILNKTLTPERTPEKLLPLNDVSRFHLTNTSILEECQKELPIDILDECLRQSNIRVEDMSGVSYQTSESDISSGRQPPQFDLPEMDLNFPDNDLLSEAISDDSSILSKDMLQLGSELDEPKPEEIKLFEKCKRAPAYVCCVCSSIFICQSTLKAHLKEHVDKNSTFVEHTMENFLPANLSDNKATLDNVCRIFQESSTSDVENELEKLYTSSLDRMWYLPEARVVLENDQSLIDAVLDDISNFPINDDDKFDESETLQLGSEIFS